MTFLRCSSCRQRFFSAQARPGLARCTLCGGRLYASPETAPHSAGTARRAERPPLPVTPPIVMTAAPGSYPAAPTTFASLTAFARARPDRIHSRERDFGLAWRNGAAVYRAAWIADTGELYIVQLGAPEEGGGHVELLATGAGLEDIQQALAGWRGACGRADSLAWLRERARRHLPGPATTEPPEPALA
jgi:hypothetical protein